MALAGACDVSAVGAGLPDSSVVGRRAPVGPVGTGAGHQGLARGHALVRPDLRPAERTPDPDSTLDHAWAGSTDGLGHAVRDRGEPGRPGGRGRAAAAPALPD